ncbi:proline dehydrogenase family protein [Haloarcula salinisoli]|uniref:proline dehydrogenase n=1 Tax=Haloarcula salinisoli TaxID=2487746 RepID=A0A8J7YIX4_9EURY|nr:proline dehydrogenase family protein [Halomicroarcula salinisoli]MBX0284978.1 proline dehydrogenase family protein [Halomicroarcula salinisoli]MBX0303544.1 proline dehydrogenase family protein [Halomicroarcula salinisoli]
MIPPIANNFVAGETAAEALDHVEELNARGVKGILNLLGEHYEDRADADADAEAYIDLAEGLARRDLDGCISVKPSQIGLEVGDDAFEENLARIVEAADCFVWVDMEDHDTVDVTLDAFERHARETDGNVGVCVQANLRRTGETLERLADCPGKVRLVKGAYDPPAEIAYTEKSKVDEMYREYLTYMFEEFDDGIAVGSHDPAMTDLARELHEEHGTPFEIQMLTGVRESAQFELAEEYEVYQYIPYGSKWFSYFYRRIRERKQNALFALRAVVGS